MFYDFDCSLQVIPNHLFGYTVFHSMNTVTKGYLYRSGTSGAKILRIEILDGSPKMRLLFILQSIMVAYAYSANPPSMILSVYQVFAYMRNYSHNLHF